MDSSQFPRYPVSLQCVDSQATSPKSPPLFGVTVQSVLQHVKEAYDLDVDAVCFSRTLVGLTAGIVLDLSPVIAAGIHIDSVTASERGFLWVGVSLIEAVFVAELSTDGTSVVVQLKRSVVEFPFVLHLSGMGSVYVPKPHHI